MNRLPEREIEHIKQILVIGALGIGNLLLFSGGLRGLRRLFPDAHITMIVLKEGFKHLYEHDRSIDEVLVLDVDNVQSVSQKISFLKELRKKKFQLCITTFPANRLEYNLLAFASGAKWRIAHQYSSKQICSLSFLQNIRIPVDKTLHDFDQNCNLLGPLGYSPVASENYVSLPLLQENHEEAEKYLDENNCAASLVIGMHPGSSMERNMVLKRWGSDKFAELSRWLAETYGAYILLFGGKEEEQLRYDIHEKAQTHTHVITNLDFLTTTALISRCNLFITNDSGLMHVAVAAGTQTIAIFGPTDPGRTAPYGNIHSVVRTGIDCSPCWSIHNLGVGNVNCIHEENLCLTQLPVEAVRKEIELRFKNVEK